jgi:hypothetical protein
MTPAHLLATLRERGVTVEARGDRLRLSPAAKVTETEFATLLAHKRAVLAVLQDERRRLYAQLTEDIGSDEDARILRHLTDHGHEGLVGELLALDGRCHELTISGASEDEFRAAVEALVSRVREMREVWRQSAGGRASETADAVRGERRRLTSNGK